jgi:hypothetical protein
MAPPPQRRTKAVKKGIQFVGLDQLISQEALISLHILALIQSFLATLMLGGVSRT